MRNYLSKLWIGFMIALLLPVAVFAETYTYDTAGRLTSAIYADGSSIAYTYDKNGNILNKTVTGNVADTTKPVITLLGTTPLTIAHGSIYSDSGATALDNVDGSITTNIVTVNSVDTGTIGSYTVTYNVSDGAGNAAAQVTRTVNVIDQTIPVITLLGSSPLTIAHGSTYNDSGATAVDNVDDNITANIVTDNPVNTSVIGSYTVIYNVSDGAGNAATQVTRTINVTDQTAPVITVSGNNPHSLQVGGSYADAGATALDAADGVVTASTTDSVDTTTAGVYILTYTATDTAGNSSTATRRIKVTPSGTTNEGTTVQVPLTGSNETVDIYSAGEVLTSFSTTSTAGTTPPSGVSFPTGLVHYATTATPGSSQTVSLTFSTALPGNLVLYKVNSAGDYTLIPSGAGVNQWIQVDTNTVALRLVDGGVFDLDGAANGVIVDPVGVGVGAAAGGSGGCVINTNSLAVDPILPIVIVLSLCYLVMRRKQINKDAA